jgi:hypothetical protein
MKYFSLLLLVASCGPQEENSGVISTYRRAKIAEDAAHVDADLELRPFLEELVAKCELMGLNKRELCFRNLTDLKAIKWREHPLNPKNESTIGFCQKAPHERWIAIRSNYFKSESHSLRFLMWHELGHCLFDLPHVENNELDIMTPYVPSEANIIAHWEEMAEKFLTNEVNSTESCNLMEIDQR